MTIHLRQHHHFSLTHTDIVAPFGFFIPVDEPFVLSTKKSESIGFFTETGES